MEELDKIFKKIREENKDFEERVSLGDIFVPHVILSNKDLTTAEQLYLASYYCYKKDIKKTDENSMLTKEKIIRIKKKLYKLNYLTKKAKTPEDLKKETIEKSHNGYKCEWCGHECYILHHHHFPIPNKEGGTNVVDICPNCHYTFHKLEGETYE